MSDSQGQIYYAKNGKSLSSTTEHLLIGAASVGITIAVMFIGFMLYRIHKGKTTLPKIFQRKRPERKLEVSAPLRKKWSMPGYAWERKGSNASDWTNRDLPPVPGPTFSRRESLKDKAVPLNNNRFLRYVFVTKMSRALCTKLPEPDMCANIWNAVPPKDQLHLQAWSKYR